MSKVVGILHPGQMGISVAATIKNSGHEVLWVSEGRSKVTLQRADGQDLVDVRTLGTLCQQCQIIVSVCPPHAATDVAAAVVEAGFDGLYIDANAVSPQRVKRIETLVNKAGIRFVDGGIVGGPAWKPGTTWLYLSGEEATEVAALFSAGPLETEVIGVEIGKSSALKMCYAAYTKGSTALTSAILAVADDLNVRDNLEKQWTRDWMDFSEKAQERARRVTRKAWRFAGEMEEIANTFEFAGLPGGFHRAAATVYRRMAHFKDEDDLPPLTTVLKALLEEE